MNPDVAAKKAKLAELRAKNLSRHVDARAPHDLHPECGRKNPPKYPLLNLPARKRRRF